MTIIIFYIFSIYLKKYLENVFRKIKIRWNFSVLKMTRIKFTKKRT